jgi:probable rRNA maturation factor
VASDRKSPPLQTKGGAPSSSIGRRYNEEHREEDRLKPVLHGVIENGQRVVGVQVRPLEEFLRKIVGEIGLGPESVAVRLIGDGEMARLNERYRKKNGPTDVLSFPVIADSGKPGTLRQQVRKARGKFLGDIAIAPRVARRNAKALGRGLAEELKVLILHGVLHLLGYDHETDRGEMERIEMRLRRKLGIA